MAKVSVGRSVAAGGYEPTLADMLRLPYLISSSCIENLVRTDPDEVGSFLGRHVGFLDRVWHAHGDAALVLLAASSLSAQVEGRVPVCLPVARLYLLEAEVLLAAASHPDLVLRALSRAEQAQDVLAALGSSPGSFELLSESMLVAGVALKALGQVDDSVTYLRGKVREWHLDPVQAVALAR